LYKSFTGQGLFIRRVECGEHAISYAKFLTRSHDAVIRVYDAAGNVIETQEHKGDFREP
jgi:hypothetical protein